MNLFLLPRPPSGTLRTAALALTLVTASVPAWAEIATLTDLNSELTFDTEAAGGSPFGLTGWKVDNVNHAFQDSFWYRVGSQTREFRVDGSGPLQHLVSAPTDFNPNPGHDDFLVVYEDTETVLTPETFTITLHYALSGGAVGSHQSVLLTDFSIDNSGDERLAISLYHYADFNLSGSGAHDHLEVNSGTATQTDSQTKVLQQQLFGLPHHFEASTVPLLLTHLDDGAISTLSGNGGPLGSGNLAWGYQWDLTVAGNAGESRSWATTISAVPEPAAAIPVSLSLVALAGYCWRTRRAHAGHAVRV